MKKAIVVFLISLLLLTTFPTTFAQEKNEELNIEINNLKGISYRKTDQGFFEFFKVQVWTRLLDNANIKEGETLKTAPDSILTLNLGSNNIVELKEKSILKIAESISTQVQNLSVQKGKVIINSNLNPEQEFNIEVTTPNSIINGTYVLLNVEVNKYRTLISVQQGEVTLTEKTTLQEINLIQGQLAIVENNEIKKYDPVAMNENQNS